MQRALVFGGGAAELGAVQDGADNGFDVAVRFGKGLGGACDERRGRVVGHETADELAGDETREGGMGAEGIEYTLAVALAAIGGDGDAKNGLGRVVVLFGVEFKAPAPPTWVDGPTGEAARGLADVALGIARIHAERMEFEQLARIIFVGRMVIVFVIVEIVEHGGRVHGCPQEVVKVTQGVRANHIGIVHALEPRAVELVLRDAEMVGPKICHDLMQLPRAVNGAQEGGLLELLFCRILSDVENEVRVHAERVETTQSEVAVEIVERVGRELFFEPRVETDFIRAGELEGARGKGDAAEAAPGFAADMCRQGGGWFAAAHALHNCARRSARAEGEGGGGESAEGEEFATGDRHLKD